MTISILFLLLIMAVTLASTADGVSDEAKRVISVAAVAVGIYLFYMIVWGKPL